MVCETFLFHVDPPIAQRLGDIFDKAVATPLRENAYTLVGLLIKQSKGASFSLIRIDARLSGPQSILEPLLPMDIASPTREHQRSTLELH